MDVAAHGTGTIRSATLADAGALARLFASVQLEVTQFDLASATAGADGSNVIVFDVGAGTLGAAAHIVFDHTKDEETLARIECFVIHPALAGSGAEERMASAVLAICEAYRCAELDVGRAHPFVERHDPVR